MTHALTDSVIIQFTGWFSSNKRTLSVKLIGQFSNLGNKIIDPYQSLSCYSTWVKKKKGWVRFKQNDIEFKIIYKFN